MTIIHKAATAEVDGMEFVLSDATVDRYGDIVEPGGWDLRDFKKNPIALFGHDNAFPIGTWANVRVEAGKLKAVLRMATDGTSARIDELRRLIEQGILRAVSVGFRPMEAEPMDPARPYGPQRFKKQQLLECSVVSVPANTAALAVARSLSISEDTLSLAFGEQADMGEAVVRRGTTGVKAATPTVKLKGFEMKTISQRVEDAQKAFVEARDAYNAHIADDDFDMDAAEGLEATMGEAEKRLDALKRAEKNLASRISDRESVAAPSVSLKGRQKDVEGFDLLVRAVSAQGIAHHTGKSIDQVLDERYKGHEATAIITKADQTIGTTTVAGWAAEIVQTVYAGFLDALTPFSIYPAVAARGIRLSFDGYGTVSIPSRTAGGAAGGFVGEGQLIRVGRITTAAASMTAKKLGVIVPFSKELAKRSTPAIEGLVRQAILEDTATTLDPLFLDAVAGDTVRPAGLLNGVAAVATGAGGGDYEAVIADINALLAPFDAANASSNITLIMHPAQARKLAFMPGPDGTFGWSDRLMSEFNIVKSTSATNGRLIALRNSDLATAEGDSPEFDISEQATVHMEDTNPLEIVSGTGPTTADPVRSFFQTATVGVRMLMDMSWKMRRSGMVQWINGTSW